MRAELLVRYNLLVKGLDFDLLDMLKMLATIKSISKELVTVLVAELVSGRWNFTAPYIVTVFDRWVVTLNLDQMQAVRQLCKVAKLLRDNFTWMEIMVLMDLPLQTVIILNHYITGYMLRWYSATEFRNTFNNLFVDPCHPLAGVILVDPLMAFLDKVEEIQLANYHTTADMTLTFQFYNPTVTDVVTDIEPLPEITVTELPPDEAFIQFLVDNNFDTSFLPKAPNLIPYILENLQKTTGVQLHEDTINFPSRFFNHESDISKHQNLLAYLDFLLWKIEYYGERHQTELRKSNQLYSQLANLKTDNAVLNDIQQYLLQKFDFSLQNLEEKLLQFKSESIAYLEKIDRVDSIWQYAENQPSIDFNLIGEAITRLYNNQITKVTQFSESVSFLQALFDKVNALFIANQQFITAQKEQFRLSCEKEYVEDSFTDLFSEWQAEITVIENHYFPIIQACFIGTINQTATLQILSLLADYRHAVDSFFLQERIALIQEYHENPKSEFLQKIDMENKLFKSRCALRMGLKNLITHESAHLTKKLLNAESQTLLTQQVSNLLIVSQEANLSKTLQAEFDELQQRNFEIYLADVEQYGHELEKRDKDIQALLFKMKKDLQRQTKGE